MEFSAKHLMITKVKGRFTDVEGFIYADDKNIKDSSVEATLKAATIDTRTEQRDNHLRSADFLEVENIRRSSFAARESKATSRSSSSPEI